ncbi:3061_t:CDS:2, partial [Gigaspora rosea]
PFSSYTSKDDMKYVLSKYGITDLYKMPRFKPNENDEHVTYNISNHEENFLQNYNDENDIYDCP